MTMSSTGASNKLLFVVAALVIVVIFVQMSLLQYKNINFKGSSFASKDLENFTSVVEISKELPQIRIDCSRDMIIADMCQYYFKLNDLTLSYTPPRRVAKQSKLIVGVLSAASNVEKRASVRETWFQYNGDWTGIFLVAIDPLTTKLSVVEAIERENIKYGDLLILRQEEIYKNTGESILPFKTAAFLSYSKKSGTQWTLKTDDDSYVNIPYILHFCESRDSLSMLYAGKILRDKLPIRSFPHKWYVSYDIWPEEHYPDYAAGAGYLLSRPLLQCVEAQLPNCRYNPNEDVLVGALVQKCNAVLEDINFIYCCDDSGNKFYYTDPLTNDKTAYGLIGIKHYVKSLSEMKYYFEMQQHYPLSGN